MLGEQFQDLGTCLVIKRFGATGELFWVIVLEVISDFFFRDLYAWPEAEVDEAEDGQ